MWWLICGGGEPFLHPQIMDMISHVKNNNFYCQVTTNFSNSVTDERIDELIKLQTNQLIINTSAGTEETYCKTRKVKKLAWDKLLHNLNYISNKKEEVGSVNPEVLTKFILTRTNVHEIGEMIDLAIKTKVDTLTFKRFLINDYADTNPYPSAIAINLSRNNDNLKDLVIFNFFVLAVKIPPMIKM